MSCVIIIQYMGFSLLDLFGRLIRIKINGAINQKLTFKVYEGLNKIKYRPVHAVIVSINSHGGSLTQSKNIADILKNFALQKNAPIFCFAEDQCLGPANLLLTTGVKAYSNSMCVLGDFSFIWSNLNLRNWSSKSGFRREQLVGGGNSPKYDLYSEWTPQAQQFTKRQLSQLTQELKSSIIQNRAGHLNRKKITEEMLENAVFNKPANSVEEFMENGIIDGIMNAEDMIDGQFRNVKVHNVLRKHPFDRFRFAFGSEQIWQKIQ